MLLIFPLRVKRQTCFGGQERQDRENTHSDRNGPVYVRIYKA